MVIKEQHGFVIKEGDNMFDKGFGSDIRFIFDVNIGFDENKAIDYFGKKYISGTSLKSTLRSFLLEYEQRGIVDDIKEFFNWLLDNLRNDIKTIKENNYECLYDEYHRVEKLLKNKSGYISNYDYLNLLNYDSLQRLKKILLSYKEEYAVFQKCRKDIVFYNDLLAWYEDIPEDLIMFIKNLYEKQFEDYLNAYILKDTLEIQECSDECNFAA
ncbi:hypothetical protein [Caldanaerobius polysaccharolyticus]|uniref:hypothetical protein n=1 Tax=Caldanaerobius polysaccharolyticus TaxID=44256 RepID=UPI00047B635D|nr:hypothetical protein [Caldanaerobius polysaccharolyticus]